jgi:hypothetical protein
MDRAIRLICATLSLVLLTHSELSAEQSLPVLSFNGFIVGEPPGGNWEKHTREIQSVPIFFVKRHSFESPLTSIALMISGSMARIADSSKKGIIDHLTAGINQNWPGPIQNLRIVEYSGLYSAERPIHCIGYRFSSVEDDPVNGPSESLNLWATGYRCKHPLHPGIVIDISYSQRSDGDQWHAEFDDEADAFLRSFAFTPLDMTSQTILALETFSKMLAGVGDTDTSLQIDGYAEALKSQQDSTEPSVYLGFDPAEELTRFADFLSDQGLFDESTYVRALAVDLAENNLANVICLSQPDECMKDAPGIPAETLTFFW